MTERKDGQPKESPELASPFTSGTVTIGYPFDAREQRELDDLERLEEDEAREHSPGSEG